MYYYKVLLKTEIVTPKLLVLKVDFIVNNMNKIIKALL